MVIAQGFKSKHESGWLVYTILRDAATGEPFAVGTGRWLDYEDYDAQAIRTEYGEVVFLPTVPATNRFIAKLKRDKRIEW